MKLLRKRHSRRSKYLLHQIAYISKKSIRLKEKTNLNINISGNISKQSIHQNYSIKCILKHCYWFRFQKVVKRVQLVETPQTPEPPSEASSPTREKHFNFLKLPSFLDPSIAIDYHSKFKKLIFCGSQILLSM